MRKFYLPVVWACTYALSALNLHGQSKSTELPIGNYLVVGAYLPGDEAYLDLFVKSLQAKNLNPKTGFESNRNFYYVYLEVYQNFAESVIQMQKARQSGLENAWIRVIKDSNATTVAAAQSVKDIASTTVQETIKPETITQKVPEKTVVTQPEIAMPKDSIAVDPPIDNPPAAPVITPIHLQNADLFISLYNAQKNKVIQGEVEIIDTERARLLTKVKGNEYFKIIDPKSKNGQLTLICDIFGYRKEQKQLSYPNPVLDEQAELVGHYFLVKFQLIPYQRGDTRTLYHVLFYNDAAIMLSESKYELNQVLDMMNENPNTKIILHGHTNGNARGKIITMGPSKDFFNLTKDVKTVSGTSKELSNQRAIAIQQWLVSNGVALDRIGVKPWGGKKMLHDKNGVNAKKNIRVEVEVVAN
jgi:outer membrane protein OmpA-like peptidoglycan-associated protein